jgi:hypothetical protein
MQRLTFESIQFEFYENSHQAKRIETAPFRLAKEQLGVAHELLHAAVFERGDRKVS